MKNSILILFTFITLCGYGQEKEVFKMKTGNIEVFDRNGIFRFIYIGELVSHQYCQTVDINYFKKEFIYKANWSGIEINEENIRSCKVYKIIDTVKMNKFVGQCNYEPIHLVNFGDDLKENKELLIPESRLYYLDYNKTHYLAYERKYKEDRSSYYTEFYPNGNKRMEGKYNPNDEPQGVWLFYDKNGRVEEKEYSNGKEISK